MHAMIPVLDEPQPQGLGPVLAVPSMLWELDSGSLQEDGVSRLLERCQETVSGSTSEGPRDTQNPCLEATRTFWAMQDALREASSWIHTEKNVGRATLVFPHLPWSPGAEISDIQ